MKRRTTIYRDGLIFLGIMLEVFLGAVVRQVNLLLLFASILVCFVLFDYRLGKRLLAGLTVRRLPPPNPHAGEPFLVEMELTNAGRGTVWGVVVEETVSPLQTAHGDESVSAKRKVRRWCPACYFDEIPPGESIRQTWAGRLPSRGFYRLGPVTVSTRFPLGFFRSAIRVEEDAPLTVWPKIGRIDPGRFLKFREKIENRARFQSRPVRTDDELFGLRDWQSGDMRKWVHQRATAKYQRLLVRQFQERRQQGAAVILDLPVQNPPDIPTSALPVAPSETVELAVSLAATLFSDLARIGYRRLIFGANAVSSPQISAPFPFLVAHNAGGGPVTAGVMDFLAGCSPTKEDRLAALFMALANLGNPPTQILLVTTEPCDLLTRLANGFGADERRITALAHKTTVLETTDPQIDEFFIL